MLGKEYNMVGRNDLLQRPPTTKPAAAQETGVIQLGVFFGWDVCEEGITHLRATVPSIRRIDSLQKF